MPAPVLQAIRAHLDLEEEIGGYEASDMRSEEIAAVYESIGSLVGAQSRNMAVVGSATAAFVQALSAFDFAPGDEIVTTRSDYTSYQIQLLALARRVGVRIIHAEDLPEGGVDPDSVKKLISSRCRLVTVSWVPTHSGTIQDVEAVGTICAEAGVPYHVDACQAVGQLPIDVNKLNCDYLSATARKFLRGPRGMGFLFVSDRALARGDYPLFMDMRGGKWVAPDRIEMDSTARRFEDWESPYALVLGMGAAAEYSQEVGETGRVRAAALATYLREKLQSDTRLRLLDRGRLRSAIITVEISGRNAVDISEALRERGINTSVTLQWYGLLDLGERGVESAVRFSPHYYNTEDEIDQAVSQLLELL